MKKSFWFILLISISVFVHGQKELVGVGIELNSKFKSTDYVLKYPVKSVVKKSPADRVGIREGDFLLEVDGIELKHLTIEMVAHLLVYFPGTECKIKLHRGGREMDFVFTREEDRELKYTSDYEKLAILSYILFYTRESIAEQATGDDDFDGVYNSKDKCPTDSGTKENKGCPKSTLPSDSKTEPENTPPPAQPAPPASSGNFCTDINTVLDAYLSGFKNLMGERVQSGFDMNYKSNVTINGATEVIFTEVVDEEAGEVFYVFKADFAEKTPTREQAEKVYADIVNKMKACSFKSGAWVVSTTNNGIDKSTSWAPNTDAAKKPDSRYNDCDVSVSLIKSANYRVYITIGRMY